MCRYLGNRSLKHSLLHSSRLVLRAMPCDAAEYSRLQSEAEKARRSQQHLYEKANSPGNAPRAVLAQEFTTKTTISSGPMDKVRPPTRPASVDVIELL